MDIKDIAVDQRRGVQTIPTLLGADVAWRALIGASTIGCALAPIFASYGDAIAFACLACQLLCYDGARQPPNSVAWYVHVWRLCGSWTARVLGMRM